MAVPFEPPKQVTGVVCVAVAVKSLDCVIVTVAMAVQLFASVTVTVCTPAGKLVAVVVVWPPADADHK